MSQQNKTMRNYRIHTASPEPTSLQMRATCNYHSPCVWQITNLFQRRNWRIGFRLWNNIYKLFKHQKGINSKCVLVRMATWSKAGLQLLACWDCGFKSCQGHGCLSVVSIVCCQGEVSVMRWSLIQRSSADCGESCMISKPQVCRGHGPCWATMPQEKKASGIYKLKHHNCEEVFIKQIGRLLKMSCKRCVRYIRANNAQFVSTLHNLVLDMNTTLWKILWIWMEQHKRMESALCISTYNYINNMEKWTSVWRS